MRPGDRVRYIAPSDLRRGTLATVVSLVNADDPGVILRRVDGKPEVCIRFDSDPPQVISHQVLAENCEPLP